MYSQHTVLVAVAVGCPSNGCRASSSISDILASPAQKMIPPPDIWGAPFWKLACGPTKLTYQGLCQLSQYERFYLMLPYDVHPTAVVLLQPLVFLLQPPKPAPVVPSAPASHGRLCCRRGLTTPYYSHCWPGHPSTHPHPLLFYCDGSAAKPVNPRTPLRVCIHYRVFPGSVSSPS